MQKSLIALLALAVALFVGYRVFEHHVAPHVVAPVVVVQPEPTPVVKPVTKPAKQGTTPRKPMKTRVGTHPVVVGKPLDIRPPEPAPDSFEGLLARARADRNGAHDQPVDCNLIRFWYAHFTTAQIRELQRAYGPTQRELRDARICVGG